MIFVATGTQFPFDRLIKYMDEWAAEHTENVFAQLGNGAYQPQHLAWKRFVSLDEYNDKIRQATVFISHAGMGNIISAKEHGVPIIVINRKVELGEHRNDHQTEGLTWMAKITGVTTATTQAALYQQIAKRASLKVTGTQSDTGLDELVTYIDTVVSQWHNK